MSALPIVGGGVLVGLVLWDIFHTMVLPRTFASNLRIAHIYYRSTWPLIAFICRRTQGSRLRDSVLSSYGPLSLIGLIFCWTAALIIGFALMSQALGPHRPFALEAYLSGTTYFTLGLGDVEPVAPGQKVLTLVEAGVGFATLAIVIGYLPVLYQSFARRELEIAIVASRAGNPSTAAGLLTRLARNPSEPRLLQSLEQLERWCAELMENHSSYPVLAYYRSQHERQSWLGTLTTLLDTCALLQVGFENHPDWQGAVSDQAELTFSMALRAIVKSHTLISPKPMGAAPDRLSPERLVYLRRVLAGSGLELRRDEKSTERLIELRKLYEPLVEAVSHHLVLDIPPFVVPSREFQSTTPEVAIEEASTQQ